jgi:hypothetical protein
VILVQFFDTGCIITNFAEGILGKISVYEAWIVLLMSSDSVSEKCIVGLTQDSWNNEPLQAQRSRRNEDLRDILRKSCIDFYKLT